MTTQKAKLPLAKLAQGLGWFSIGLGLAEAIAPRAMATLIGMEDSGANRRLLRLFGLREIGAGVGLLSGTHTANWLWGRVSGDALDLTALGWAAESDDANRGRLAVSALAVAGVAALDVYAASQWDN